MKKNQEKYQILLKMTKIFRKMNNNSKKPNLVEKTDIDCKRTLKQSSSFQNFKKLKSRYVKVL